MVTMHIHRDFKMSHNHLIFLILSDHAKVRRTKTVIIWRNISWIAFQSYPGVTPKNFRQKKGLRFYSKPLIYLAPPDGLEPPT